MQKFEKINSDQLIDFLYKYTTISIAEGIISKILKDSSFSNSYFFNVKTYILRPRSR